MAWSYMKIRKYTLGRTYKPVVNIITHEEFQRLILGGQVIGRMQDLPVAVLDAKKEFFIKVWHRKQGFSSDRIRPYGYRFYANCIKLIERGIEAPHVEQFFQLEPGGQHVAVYRYMPGRSIDLVIAQDADSLLQDLARFYAELHNKGIFFRSIHAGNILRLDNGRYAVIDVTDTNFYSRSLSAKLCARNLVYALSGPRSREIRQVSRLERFLDAYCVASGLTPKQSNHVRRIVEQSCRTALN